MSLLFNESYGKLLHCSKGGNMSCHGESSVVLLCLETTSKVYDTHARHKSFKA